jgi:hypothetical protein
MISLSLHPAPASEIIGLQQMRAFNNRRAAPSWRRSSPLNLTTYFFTEYVFNRIPFAAMIVSATKANHKILSNWLKRVEITSASARAL